MKRNLILLLFTVGCFISNVSAQDLRQIDSLKNELKKHKQDEVAANILSKLTTSYWGINLDTAMHYAKRCLELSERLGYQKGIGNACSNIGWIMHQKGDYLQAIVFHTKALAIYEALGDNTSIANTYNMMGAVYKRQGNYPKALSYYLSALKISEGLGNRKTIGNVRNNIGLIYSAMENYPEALKNFSICLEIMKEVKNKNGVGACYNNMGIVYDKLGNYTEALKYYLLSLSIVQETGEKKTMAAAYQNIGIIYQKKGNFPEALKYHFLALKLDEEIGNQSKMAVSYLNIGKTYALEKKYETAAEYLYKALALSKQLANLEQIQSSYRELAAMDSAKGNYKRSIEHYMLYITYRDSLNNIETARKTLALQMNYDFEKKEDSLKAARDKREASLKYEKKLSEEKFLRSQQELFLKQKDLALSNKEKDLQHLAFLKEKAEKQEKEKQLTLSEKENLLKASELTVLGQERKLQLAQLFAQEQEIKTKNAQRNLFIGGTFLMLLLASSIFVGLRKTSKEKKRSETLLLNILPSEVAEELKAKGSADAQLMDEVTVLFTDFKGFTQLSEKLSPKELVSEINECFSAFDYIMQKHQVEKIKTIGDSYMAAGGLPTANTTHANDVVLAALEIQQFMQEHKATRQSKGQLFFEIRIGVHTGPVVAGIVGVKKFAYDIWGDTVNTASRMESSGEVGKVNISETTYEMVKDKFSCTHRGKIDAKGKGEMDMYFVESKA
ncbi:MAG: tetratricopeptide repeat protein [Bacteroidetes bacterium]|nr:tetratricopeptide repeat protein [Bacteroidota bacterium]